MPEPVLGTMKTKFILTINGKENELTSDCIANWDEVMCTYKRTDYSGVVRSISSKFQFAKDAYDMLLAAYLEDAVRTSASVTIYVMNDDWSWTKLFEAALNFSTVTWDNYTFNINCIDDSLASLIKSRKGTKYEFEIGKEIEVGGVLNYDRITMQNSCAHYLMGEKNASDGAVLIRNAGSLTRLPTYSLNAETFENSPILYENQTTDNGSAFITAIRQVSNAKMRLEIWANDSGYGMCYAKNVEIHLMRFSGDDQGMTDLGVIFSYAAQEIKLSPGSGTWGLVDRTCVGTFKSLEELKRAYPNPPQDVWAKIAKSTEMKDVESVYFTPISNKKELVQWELGRLCKISTRRKGPIVRVSCETKKYIMEFDFDYLGSGQKFAICYTANIVNWDNQTTSTPYFPLYSKITTHWDSKANAIDIQAVQPITLISKLFERICDGNYNIILYFSNYDPRLAKTYLLAAESVRAIYGAKIYTTFNDFCDWMETVFGYVYTLGEPIPAQYNGMKVISGIYDDWAFDAGDVHGRVVDGYCPHEHYIEEPFFIRSHNCFCVWDNHETANMYTQWKDSHKYNDENGKGRKDLIFDDGSKYYVIGANDDLVEFVGDAKAASRITQPINFVHRSELFQNQDQGVFFYDAKGPQNKVNNSILYSTVEVGYEKQDYETECGRDEWNFMNYYNTGVDVVEKKLSLQSKYRADCYGLEFLSQERAKDTTDNKSDNTVFFVYTKLETKEEEQKSGEAGSRGDDEEVAIQETTTLVIDRSAKIQGALTDTVFNGEFSPYYCVKANEGYISAVAPNVVLQFASSDGNSDIVIDGVKTTANIPLTQRLFSESEFEFVATDLEQSIDFSKLIKVVSNGLIYSGFLKQTEFCYPKPQEVKYTLIVKDIKPI